jgi:hypothetical protein
MAPIHSRASKIKDLVFCLTFGKVTRVDVTET